MRQGGATCCQLARVVSRVLQSRMLFVDILRSTTPQFCNPLVHIKQKSFLLIPSPCQLTFGQTRLLRPARWCLRFGRLKKTHSPTLHLLTLSSSIVALSPLRKQTYVTARQFLKYVTVPAMPLDFFQRSHIYSSPAFFISPLSAIPTVMFPSCRLSKPYFLGLYCMQPTYDFPYTHRCLLPLTSVHIPTWDRPTQLPTAPTICNNASPTSGLETYRCN